MGYFPKSNECNPNNYCPLFQLQNNLAIWYSLERHLHVLDLTLKTVSSLSMILIINWDGGGGGGGVLP